jgi:hypothetical protein
LDEESKPLSLTGTNVGLDFAKSALHKVGFDALNEISGKAVPLVSPWYKTYFPVLLILAYLVVLVTLSQVKAGEWSWNQMMRHFMGGFFVVFSFFKLLNLSRFAAAYATYDIAAMHLRAYGYIYPFIEVWLGAAYMADFGGLTIDLVTLVVMTISTLGVVRSLLRKQAIRCACLGTIFNLPMSRITLIEDLLMVAMSAASVGAALFHFGRAS